MLSFTTRQLDAHAAPLIDDAIKQVAPQEGLYWAITTQMVTELAGPNQLVYTVRTYLVLFGRHPIPGQSITSLTACEPLDLTDADKVTELVRKIVDDIRSARAKLLTATP